MELSTTFIENYALFISLCIFVFLIDDLFIDLVAIYKKLKPRPISKSILFTESNRKKIAIMVANWKEESVLEEMVHGNMNRLTSDNVHLFLGVYPNDLATRKIAERMARTYPRVHVVINQEQGPTYKGQMLNQIINYIFAYEEVLGFEFEGFVLHDSEDIIDPRLPYLYSLGLRQADFVQTPVFSLPVEFKDFTAGTYIDEFAEVHTKTLLVRQALGAGLPSAGVGTCLSRKLVLIFLSRQNGEVFLSDSLTEDYQLGLQAAQWGFSSRFMCHYLQEEDPRDVISTREYFPHKFTHSIRQKSRWTTGISFQGFKNIGWFGHFWQRYFLWRDRKGPINALLTLNLFVLMALLLVSPKGFDFANPYLQGILLANTLGTILRFVTRVQSVHRLYDTKTALTSIIRWPVAMVINMCSGLKATQQFIASEITGRRIRWVKTEHRLPVGFGDIIAPPTPIPLTNITTHFSENNNDLRRQETL